MTFFKQNSSDETKLRAYAHRCGAFDCKKSAFDYFFITEGKSIEEAERLADILAKARNIPDIPTPAAGTFDKIKSYIKQGQELATENPKVTDFLIGLVSGAITSIGGVAVGSKIAETKSEVRNDININLEPKEIGNVTTV